MPHTLRLQRKPTGGICVEERPWCSTERQMGGRSLVRATSPWKILGGSTGLNVRLPHKQERAGAPIHLTRIPLARSALLYVRLLQCCLCPCMFLYVCRSVPTGNLDLYCTRHATTIQIASVHLSYRSIGPSPSGRPFLSFPL
jgi:hypothetical protein